MPLLLKKRASSPRRELRRKARTRLGWCFASLAMVSVSIAAALEFGDYRIRDPEFHAKLHRLEKLLARDRQRPLWLMLGTSKLADGLKPDLVSGGADPIVFNFGRPGASVLWQYLALHRLLEAGIQPEWLGVEIMGPTLSRSVPIAPSDLDSIATLRHHELDIQRPFSSNDRELRQKWWRTRLSPELLLRQASDTVTGSHKRQFDEFGWRPTTRTAVSPQVYAQNLEARRKEYLKFWNDFGIGDEADRCLRALLDLARSRGIKTFIYELPEATPFRETYPAGTREAIEAYLGRIVAEHRIPWVNARNWVADSAYSDGLHMLMPGVEQFSTRFRDEVFHPFVRQWPAGPSPVN